MGVAAGLMTESDKLGFVAAFPLGWTTTFINAFTLGAQSVNPDVQTTVAYTFNWGDRAKEADATNSLINQGADVIAMHVDSPQLSSPRLKKRAPIRLASKTWQPSSSRRNIGSAALAIPWETRLPGSLRPFSMGPGNRSFCAVV
jgi:hypothetical protein